VFPHRTMMTGMFDKWIPTCLLLALLAGCQSTTPPPTPATTPAASTPAIVTSNASDSAPTAEAPPPPADVSLPLTERPELGAVLRQCAGSPAGSLTASAQRWPACRATHAGIDYVVGVEGQGVVRFIETSDRKFVTPEGLRIGSTVAAVRAAGGQDVRNERGWGYNSQLPSGWYARFQATATNELPSDATVTSFYKR